MYCKKCHAEITAEDNFCHNCGSSLFNNITSSKEPNGGNISSKCIGSVIASIASFFFTVILRCMVATKTDLTPAALSSRYGRVVLDNAKPYVLAVPIIVSMLLLINAVMTEKMTKKEKAVVFIVVIFSLLCSIGVINLQMYIKK